MRGVETLRLKGLGAGGQLKLETQEKLSILMVCMVSNTLFDSLKFSGSKKCWSCISLPKCVVVVVVVIIVVPSLSHSLSWLSTTLQ